ncbi:MAG: hypothetical protein KDN22_15735 [Verrucomicrobiae bacterium]|nr:hypothetical protein [Verrucomicrobiae bacterium]
MAVSLAASIADTLPAQDFGGVEDLAVYAADIVIDQLTAATTQVNHLWASQPGAISVFDSTSADGVPSQVFKLYSAQRLGASGVLELDSDVPADWQTQPEFVDLNAPVTNADGTIAYPILDARFSGAGLEVEGGVVFAAPEGFDVDSTAIEGIVPGEAIPMPVRWLYIGESGELAIPAADGTLTRADGSLRPVTAIGRIAFWTDDESAKINMNTSSEGVYWDTPHVDTIEERQYAGFQPWWGEYQRYAGHPAMVSTSSFFHPWKRYYLPGTAGALEPLPLENAEELWRIAPGVNAGGSRGGTIAATPGTPQLVSEFHGTGLWGKYASLDEVVEKLSGVDLRTRISSGGFFLTTDSAAADYSLNGHPRTAIWPVDTTASEDKLSPYATDFDRAIAEVATAGGEPYYFQRERMPNTRHRELYETADGVNFLNYFRRLGQISSEPISGFVPGFGLGLGDKYSLGKFGDVLQIQLEIFDRIRASNASDPALPPQNRYAGFGDQLCGLCRCGGREEHRVRWPNPRLPYGIGWGRTVTVDEVAFFAICRAQRTGENSGLGLESEWRTLTIGEQLVEVGFLVETVGTVGGGRLSIDSTLLVGGGSGVTIEPSPLSSWVQGEPLLTEIGSVNSFSGPSVLNAEHRSVMRFTGSPTFQRVVKAADQPLNFSGTEDRGSGQLRIVLFNKRDSNDIDFQTQSFHLAFPPFDVGSVIFWNPSGDDAKKNDLASRFAFAREHGIGHLINPDTDIVQSVVPADNDVRLLASRRVVDPGHFVAHPDYGRKQMAHSLRDGDQLLPGGSNSGTLILEADYPDSKTPKFPIAADSPDFAKSSDSRAGKERGPYDPVSTGDFETGIARSIDGDLHMVDDGDAGGDGRLAYFDPLPESGDPGRIPNPHRSSPSPVVFGSLPTGVQVRVPWQTLLFRPHDPAKHFGARMLPDHLFLDWFRMPIVEPYRISTPFATEGRINMNHWITPFSYIKRTTALHAAMKPEKLLAIPTSAANRYKTEENADVWRHHIDANETLRQWKEKHSRGEVFRTASEICEQWLVPEGETLETLPAFWKARTITGDNVKERPYAALYPKMTTRSQAYRMHYRVQKLTPGTTTVVNDLQGSMVLRRSVPDETKFPPYDYLRPSLDTFHSVSIQSASPPLSPLGSKPYRFEMLAFDTDESNDGLTFQMTIASKWGRAYVLERSLDGETWEPVTDTIDGTNSPITLIHFIDRDTLPPITLSWLYRARMVARFQQAIR